MSLSRRSWLSRNGTVSLQSWDKERTMMKEGVSREVDMYGTGCVRDAIQIAVGQYLRTF